MGRPLRRMLGLVVAAAITASVAGAPVAVAEKQTETIVSEQRTSISLRVTLEAAQSLLPAGWTATAPNLSLTFMDRKLALTPDGKPLFSGVNRVLVMSVSAKNAQTGETKGLIVGGYSADPAGVPGAYNVYSNGSIDLSRNERIEGVSANVVTEQWTVKAADGGTLNVNLSFTRGVPTLAPFELKIHSGADPSFYRIYRGEQATDVLRSPNGGADRVQSITVKASGGMLGRVIGDNAQVISVSNSPYYSRKTFLP